MLKRMGKRRRTNKHLPTRVYLKYGTYYYVTRDNKWLRLGKTEPEMLRALGTLRDSRPVTFGDVLDRYISEIMPRKNAQTRCGEQFIRKF
jgi:hypothetical protein